jgi:4-amino-4-deoxy-L-arabinose transferase-like glycosyltransferase
VLNHRAKVLSEGAFACLAALLPALFIYGLHRTAPHFPREFDDAGYWSDTIRIVRGAEGVGWWSAIFWERAFRPILFPVLGVPFFVATGSIALSMQLFMPLLFGTFSFIVFRIFRLGASNLDALLATLVLCTLPVTLESASYFMTELPFLCLSAFALYGLLKKSLRPLWAVLIGLSIGGSLCIRPVEASFVWALLLLYFAWKSPALWRLFLLSLVTALAAAGFWYYPFLGTLLRWVNIALFYFGAPGNPRLRSWSELGERAVQAFQLGLGAYTYWGLGFVLVSLFVWARRERRVSFEQWGVIGLGLLPPAASILIANRISTGEARHVVATTLLCVGYYLLRLHGWRVAGRVVALALLAANLSVVPAMVTGHIGIQAQNRRAKEACLAALGPGTEEIAENSRVLFLSDSGLPLGASGCSLAFTEKGKNLYFSKEWDPRFYYWSLLQTFGAIVLVTNDEKALLGSASSLGPVLREQLREVLGKSFYALRRSYRFSFEGRSFEAVLYRRL